MSFSPRSTKLLDNNVDEVLLLSPTRQVL